MRRWITSCGFVLALACGQKPAESPETPAPERPEAESEAAPAPVAEEPTAGDTDAEPSAEAEKSEPRTVKYIMTTGGLEIEVEGVRFTPKASPVKIGGGWGIAISVQAKVLDDNAHSLLDPARGALAFAGSIERGGQTTRIADKREGDGEKLIGPGETVKLERKWPDKGGEKPLTAGQSVALEVGLWGLGPDADQRRAVRDFFQIKMRVDKGKPQPVISPPPSANP